MSGSTTVPKSLATWRHCAPQSASDDRRGRELHGRSGLGDPGVCSALAGGGRTHRTRRVAASSRPISAAVPRLTSATGVAISANSWPFSGRAASEQSIIDVPDGYRRLVQLHLKSFRKLPLQNL